MIEEVLNKKELCKKINKAIECGKVVRIKDLIPHCIVPAEKPLVSIEGKRWITEVPFERLYKYYEAKVKGIWVIESIMNECYLYLVDVEEEKPAFLRTKVKPIKKYKVKLKRRSNKDVEKSR